MGEHDQQGNNEILAFDDAGYQVRGTAGRAAVVRMGAIINDRRGFKAPWVAGSTLGATASVAEGEAISASWQRLDAEHPAFPQRMPKAASWWLLPVLMHLKEQPRARIRRAGQCMMGARTMKPSPLRTTHCEELQIVVGAASNTLRCDGPHKTTEVKGKSEDESILQLLSETNLKL